MAADPLKIHADAGMMPAAVRGGFSTIEKPAYEDYSRCVHCGLCLNHCPTYRLWGKEADSPRGRIRQMALVDQGKLEIGEGFITHMDRCLDCRACETVCPSGVEYGKLIELARGQIEQKHARPLGSRILRSLVYRSLLPYPTRIAGLARLTRFFQTSGLESLTLRLGIARAFGMEDRFALLPRIDDKFFASQLGQTFPAQGKKRARVAFFAGCIARVTFTGLNDATIRVLQANGCEVVVPRDQVCCGALAAHAGMRETARELARVNFRAFGVNDVDAIITNAAGCGSTLKEYPQLFPVAGGHVAEAGRFAQKVRDVTEFLDELGLVAPMKPVRAATLRVTLQDSCHLVHGQKIREAPRRLVRAVPGVELVEMPLADYCCGSAGVYNVTQTAASMSLLEEKMRLARGTQADAIVTANPGCILQLRAGAAKFNTGQEVLHVVELLDRALAVN
ncbi:MAG: (Fe-S)-binding protein [Candidatus Acidiferrales bacterium]|jgi:glycolate oxidase iron-sulfur subunit